jgi:hypothetical protein
MSSPIATFYLIVSSSPSIGILPHHDFRLHFHGQRSLCCSSASTAAAATAITATARKERILFHPVTGFLIIVVE